MPAPARSSAEFIALVALTTSLVALSIDAMLPALGAIAAELGARAANDRQLVLTAFFGGITVGQLAFGPLSDSVGRKRALYAGTALFVVGGLMCALATSFSLLLAGRILQGFGASGPRVVAIAMVRDLHAGRSMARVMSFVTSVFILVPIVAPSMGQGILAFANWRGIFYVLVVVSLLDLLWFALRQPETLPLERRARFSLSVVLRAAGQTFQNRIALGYTVAMGFIFGAFLNYLTTSQQIFQEQYDLGALFPLFFGGLALSIGAASLVNGKLVMRFGMRVLSRWAAAIESALSFAFLVVAWHFGGHPPLAFFMVYMVPCFFCHGVMFGNYNARAMEPMGHIAGVAASIIGSVSSLVALAMGTPFGRAYDGTVFPLAFGFAILSAGALVLTELVERKQPAASASLHEG